jgi:hypothetical protein
MGKISGSQCDKCMNMAVIWDVELCSLVDMTNVSEELTAFIIRATS